MFKIFKTFTVVNFKKFQAPLFLFSNKMLVIRTGIHNNLLRIANRGDPDQTASSDVLLHCLLGLFVKILEHLL